MLMLSIYTWFHFQKIQPSAFSNVRPSLEEIYITSNEALSKAEIQGPLQGVRILVISNNPQLSQIELTIAASSDLEYLILSDNALTSVSIEWFERKPYLKHVSVANNYICEF